MCSYNRKNLKGKRKIESSISYQPKPKRDSVVFCFFVFVGNYFFPVFVFVFFLFSDMECVNYYWGNCIKVLKLWVKILN